MILAEEFTKAGVPTGGPNDVFGIQMLGNTLLQWGTEEQKKRYLPRILSGEDTWCQGYSEPNAGSDLSNVGLKATLDGDEWVLNGQKIWTSAGHLADHIFTLARTDPDAPRHKGISFLLVDMRQPGIEVRPIKMISGDSEFNEVFYTDATTPKDEVVGGVNNGWAVAMTLLGYERGEAAATAPIRYQAEIDRLIALAREHGRVDDPVIRQRLAWAYGKVQIMRYNGMRVLTTFLKGHHPGPDGAISKLYWSEYHKLLTELAVDILGTEALVPTGRHPSSAFQTDDAGAPNSSNSWVSTFLNARAGHDLRRLLADPAQHHRRDGPRPAEGARGSMHGSAAVGSPSWSTRACGGPHGGSGGEPRRRAGGAVGRSCPSRRRSTCSSGSSPSTAGSITRWWQPMCSTT